MSTAYIYGCSHAAGSEIEEAGKTDTTPYNLANSFATQLGKLLGHNAVNQAVPGASNDYIYRKISELDANSNDLIIAAWTGCERIELYDDVLGQWLNFSKGMAFTPKYFNSTHREFYHLYERLMSDEEGRRGKLNKVKNILAANVVAKVKGIPIINIDAFWPIDIPGKDSLPWAMPGETFTSWAKQQGFVDTDWYHYRLDAHTEFAHALCEDIHQRKLLG